MVGKISSAVIILHIDWWNWKTAKVSGVSTCQFGWIGNDTRWTVLPFLLPLSNIQSSNWPRKPRNSLFRFWMSFPLRSIMPTIFRKNAQLFVVIKRLAYPQEPLYHTKNLLSAFFLVQEKPMVHRNNYHYWIQEVKSPGKIEVLKPTSLSRSLWWRLQPSLHTSEKSCPCSTRVFYLQRPGAIS